MKYLVYELWNPISGIIFYVGKGDKNRPTEHLYEVNSSRKYSNQLKINIIRKILKLNLKPEIKIVFFSDSEKECFLEEKRLIKFYGRRDLGLGPLTNMTDGGEGHCGPFSKEHKQNIKKSMMGKNIGNTAHKNKLHSLETKQKLSEIKKGKYIRENNPFYGKKHSEESKNKIRLKRSKQIITEETKFKMKLGQLRRYFKNNKIRLDLEI